MNKDYRITDKKITELQPEIDNWKKEFKNITLIKLDTDPFDCICKVPTADHLKIANAVQDDMEKDRQLVLSCILYPAPEKFTEIVEAEQRDTIIVPLAVKLVELSGATQKATVKKL